MPQRDLTEGSIPGHLFRLGAPMVIGVLAVLSIHLADTYFVGQLGTDELAALSFTFPVVLTVASLSIGLSAGASSVVSRAIGQGDRNEVRRLASDSLVLSVLVVAAVCTLGWATARPLFALLGADAHVLDIVVEYMRIWFLGMPFLVLPMVGGGLIRANGDSLAPSLIMVFAAICNVVLDPVLIHGWGSIPAMGVAGAAWASLASRAATLVATLLILVFREKLLAYTTPPWDTVKKSWSRLLSVGVPAAGSNMINPIAIGVITAVLATYGKNTVAAFGVATRVEAFGAIPMLALSAAIGPIAGQNWGCDRPDRARKALRATFVFCGVYSVIAFALFVVAAEPILGIFTDDPNVIAPGASYLRIVGGTLAGYGMLITTSATYNAVDQAKRGLVLTLIRSVGLYVPLAALGGLLGGPRVAFVGIAIANAVIGLLLLRYAIRWLRK